MNVYLKWQSTSALTLLAWYNVDHKLSFHLSSE
ncbi:tryptophanase leader peptide [Pseudomonadota bacterium]